MARISGLTARCAGAASERGGSAKIDLHPKPPLTGSLFGASR